MRSRGRNFSEEIRYYYKSGFVRMEFIKPFSGAVLTYDPARREARLKPLRPLGRIITLSPDNRLIKSSAGHTVDVSDIGSLLRAAAMLRANGEAAIVGADDLSGRETILVRVLGKEGVAVSGVHRYDLWLDKRLYLPLKAATYDLGDGLIEEILMDDLEIDVDLPDHLFRL